MKFNRICLDAKIIWIAREKLLRKAKIVDHANRGFFMRSMRGTAANRVRFLAGFPAIFRGVARGAGERTADTRDI